MFWNLRLRFTKWLLQPLREEQERVMREAFAQLNQAQALHVHSIRAIVEPLEKRTIQ